jgi:hypothetical protein
MRWHTSKLFLCNTIFGQFVAGKSSIRTTQKKQVQKQKKKKKPTDAACSEVIPSQSIQNAAQSCVSGSATVVHCSQERMSTSQKRVIDAQSNAPPVSNQQNCPTGRDMETSSGEECDVHDFMAAWAWKREHLYVTYPTVYLSCIDLLVIDCVARNLYVLATRCCCDNVKDCVAALLSDGYGMPDSFVERM